VTFRLDNVNELLKLKKGDQGRLEHIKKALEKGTTLFVSDSKYLKTLTEQYLINDTEKQDIKHNYEPLAQTTKPKDIPTPKIEHPSENVNVSEPQKTESDKISFCAKCGSSIKNENFCPKCGHNLLSNVSKAEKVEISLKDSKPKKKGRSKKKKIGIVVIVFINFCSVYVNSIR